MSDSFPRVTTPCIGVCSTGLGDAVCRGCKRYQHEVIAWNGYSQDEKFAIEQRLDGLLIQVVSSKLRLRDVRLLEWQLQVQQIRYKPYKSPYVWVFELMRAGADQITQPMRFGFELDPEYADLPLREVREMIDREFFLLSEAHYQRYVATVA